MTQAENKALSILSAALEKEERGRDFYKKASESCINPLGKEIFRMLMVDEGAHIKRVKEIFDSLSKGKQWDNNWKKYKVEHEDLQKLFRKRIETIGSRVEGDNSDIEAISIGLEMEQGAIQFYEDQLAKATDALEREFAKVMISEERGHFGALKDLKLYLENPEAWFTEKEHSLLDG
ncbi:MAG: ferritin family protein [Desulfomonilaceae bacterium]